MNYSMEQLIKVNATSKPRKINGIILFLRMKFYYVHINEIITPTIGKKFCHHGWGAYISQHISHSLSLFCALRGFTKWC